MNYINIQEEINTCFTVPELYHLLINEGHVNTKKDLSKYYETVVFMIRREHNFPTEIAENIERFCRRYIIDSNELWRYFDMIDDYCMFVKQFKGGWLNEQGQ